MCPVSAIRRAGRDFFDQPDTPIHVMAHTEGPPAACCGFESDVAHASVGARPSTDEQEGRRSPIAELTAAEVEFLRALVSEPSMAHVARRIGYSERQTRRLGRRLMEQLGVPNKYAAVAKAARHRIIKELRPGERRDE
jgi:DNA-binding CsgD family transcriptional regulator